MSGRKHFTCQWRPAGSTHKHARPHVEVYVASHINGTSPLSAYLSSFEGCCIYTDAQNMMQNPASGWAFICAGVDVRPEVALRQCMTLAPGQIRAQSPFNLNIGSVLFYIHLHGLAETMSVGQQKPPRGRTMAYMLIPSGRTLTQINLTYRIVYFK